MCIGLGEYNNTNDTAEEADQGGKSTRLLELVMDQATRAIGNGTWTIDMEACMSNGKYASEF